MDNQNSEEPFKLDVVSVRLVKDAPLYSDTPVDNPKAAVSLVGKYLCDMDRELICVVNLRADLRPINCNFVGVGTLNKCIAHPRELLKTAILSNACNIIIIHNHVSGRLVPSKEDTQLTDRMAQICLQIQIPLIDHVIVGGDNKEYFSFREKGILPNSCYNYCSNYNLLEFPVNMAQVVPEDNIDFIRGR